MGILSDCDSVQRVKTEPTISVLLTVHNGMPFLTATIASIAGQSYEDWEFVIVDDASSDGTSEALDKLAAYDSRIRIVKNETRLGASGGANRGLAECRGRWIARIDADDIALPNRLERQLAFVGANPDIKATSCLAYYINSEGIRKGKTFHDLTTRAAFQDYMKFNRDIGILHPGALIERRTLMAVGGYREQFGPAHDVDLWSRIADTGAMILVQPEYLMEYRVHAASMSARMFQIARLKTQWSRACMIARRSGKAEPSWEDFEAADKAAHWRRRLNQWRKGNAKRLYRRSGLYFITGSRVLALLDIAAAGFLQPVYAVRRLSRQLLR
jgi:glycosyltransferase involved in cell wall biosynthesis